MTQHQLPAASMPAWRTWLAVVLLGLGAFAIVTTELAPVGLLSPMARDFARSEATVGLAVTVYAWIGAVAALLAAFGVARLPRRSLLIGLMLGLAVANAASMWAESFEALLVARVCGAVAHGLFWAVIGASAAQIAPPGRTGLATSIVFGGVSVASVLGVPLATWIGQSQGWRLAFSTVSALSLATAVAMALVLPRMRAEAEVGWPALGRALRRRELAGIYLATAFAVTAHFAAFTFIEPFLVGVANVRASMVAGLLLGFGAAGLLGNVLTGLFIDRFLRFFLMLALVVTSAALLAFGAAGERLGPAGVALLMAVWGAAVAAIFVGFQTWILRVAGSSALAASAVYVAIFNAAIGAGALAGSAIFAQAGLTAVMSTAAAAAALGAVIVGLLERPEAVSRGAYQAAGRP